MSEHFWDAVWQLLNKDSVLPIVVTAVVSCTLTLAGVFFRQIGSFLARIAQGIWMKMQGRGADYHFERSYLDWLIREHRHLGLLPAQLIARRWKQRQKLADLEQVFVRLSISLYSGDEQWAQTYGQGEKSWRKRPWVGLRFIRFLDRSLFSSTLATHVPFLPEQIYQPGDLGLVIDRHKRLVLRGDPGSGKTTVLRYLALTCARARRKNWRDGDSSNLVKQRFLWTQRPFPLLVRLRRHGNVINWDEAKELTETMIAELPPELRKRCPSGFFERRIQKGNCLLLLDAFDELGTSEARGAMARKIAGFLEVYKREDNRIVVTTRVVGYEGQLDHYDFIVRTMQPLQTGEIRALIKQRYAAIAMAETAWRSTQEAKDIQRKMRERAERLIEKIEQTPRLAQLAVNPMLLSLIVLVHSLKIELPEERLLLYRDCVEILTENWQQSKREEVGIKPGEREELSLTQKLVLLCELAFAMQQQRKGEGSLALVSKEVARDLIAQKLADVLGDAFSLHEPLKRDTYLRRADAWLSGIQQESGILVEQGLDEAGEPLIGFSHLTFQEYLTAVAIHENKARQPLLRQQALEPAWQEIVLLYAALTNDATSLLRSLLKSPTQPEGVLLAGRCLAERLKKVKPQTQQMIVNKLKQAFSGAHEERVEEVGNVMGLLGGSEIITFLRQQLSDPCVNKQLAAITALGQTHADSAEIDQIRIDLLHVLETSSETTITLASREALSQIGDPRFTGPEPIMVSVPPQPHHVPALLRTWKDLRRSLEWKRTKDVNKRSFMLVRIIDYWVFSRWYLFRRYPLYGYEFEIGKYPVTNMEYSRFVEATGHVTPLSWTEGTFPREKASHPVEDITKKDAEQYCQWLSKTTGKKYRLPTEWEWEWAAAGPHGWKYPWGDQFEKDRCNTQETGIDGTTPVGSYGAGDSHCGACDMVGNVLEICVGAYFFLNLVLPVIPSMALFAFSIMLPIYFEMGLNILETLIILLYVFGDLVAISAIIYITLNIAHRGILKGGSWNSYSSESTTSFRKEVRINTKKGFRCVLERYVN